MVNTQNESGQWPKQDTADVFFRTAPLDYVLYRQYYPLHALALYEQRRRGPPTPATAEDRRKKRQQFDTAGHRGSDILARSPDSVGGAAPWRRRDSSPAGIRVHPAATTIGATVEGIDLTEPITDSSGRRIREALDAYGVLVFPDQHAVDDEAQLLLAELWGSPSPAPWEAHHGRGSLITRVYTNDSHGLPTGRDCAFHTDMSFTEQIPDVGVLRPIVIPPFGGATTWADARVALGSLNPTLLDEIRGLSAHHTAGRRFAQKMALIFGAEAGDTVTSRFADGCQHPVVAAHPRTGDEVLFVNPRYTRYVLDMPDADSDDLLGRLFAAFERPELQFAHQWRTGDVAVWDEFRVVHRAPADYGSHPRELHRCTAGWHRPGPAST